MGCGVTTADVSQPAGTLAFGSISGTYATLGTFTGSNQFIVITSDLDQAVVVSLDGGTTDWVRIPEGVSMTIPLSNSHWSGVVQVKDDGTPCTTGKISVGVIRAA